MKIGKQRFRVVSGLILAVLAVDTGLAQTPSQASGDWTGSWAASRHITTNSKGGAAAGGVDKIAQTLAAAKIDLGSAGFALKRGITCYDGVAPAKKRCAAEFGDMAHASQLTYLQIYLFEGAGGFDRVQSMAETSISSSKQVFHVINSMAFTDKRTGRESDHRFVCVQGFGPKSWAYFTLEIATGIIVASQVPPNQTDAADCDHAKTLAVAGSFHVLDVLR